MTSSERSAASDQALIEAIKKGDLAAFTELVSRHQRALVNFFYRCAWDLQTAEDCAQEVFVKLYAHLDAYEPRAKFTTFLYRVARNLWIDKVRAREADPKPISLEGTGGGAQNVPLKDRIPSRGETPIETLTRREMQEALRRAIDALPKEQRLVVVLSEMQGLKYQEISEILEIPVGTVKSRMHTAIEKLKDLMRDIEPS
ncbi:MAG: sigma-70 family RNA polymerase sigma factor [Planctomycetes bacterium]|nr:sigma-70 family RNA polymerase sigma factor [Planctomycetota bacterium]